MKSSLLPKILLVVLMTMILGVSSISAQGPGNVDLASFTAEYIAGQILVEWETASELDVAGFFVTRATSPPPPYPIISPFIPNEGSPVTGAEYSFTDNYMIVERTTYYYQLEIIDINNDIQYSETISVTAAITNEVYLPIVLTNEDGWEAVDPSAQTITFWHRHSGEREETLQAIVAEFNDTNPWGITVAAEYQGGYGDIFNKMLAVLGTPDAPDLVDAYQHQAATYQLVNGLEDLTTLVESPEWGFTQAEQDDFFEGIYNQDIFPTFNNARLGFPPQRSLEIMYYNEAWLTELGYDQAPTTLDEFREITCVAATNPWSGAIATGSRGYELSIDASRFASWTFALGGDVFDYQNNQYSYNNAAAVSAMTFIQSLLNDGCITLVAERYGDQANFSQGTTLFTVGSSSGLPYYQSAVEYGANFNWSVAALPHTNEEPVMNSYGASISIPQHEPEAQLAAWLFLKYFTSPEVQAKWVQVSNYFPVRASVANDLDDYFANNPAYETAFGLLPYGQAEPSVPGYDFVRDIVADAMAAIAAGADVQATLDQLNEDANTNLAEQMAP